jgi:hypothetical protein
MSFILAVSILLLFGCAKHLSQSEYDQLRSSRDNFESTLQLIAERYGSAESRCREIMQKLRTEYYKDSAYQPDSKLTTNQNAEVEKALEEYSRDLDAVTENLTRECTAKEKAKLNDQREKLFRLRADFERKILK